MEDTQLGHRLRTIRVLRNITQAEMARRMGFKHAPVISKIESGDRKLSAIELAQWCRECGVATDAVLAGSSITVDLSEASA